jgi:hypothetical protein
VLRITRFSDRWAAPQHYLQDHVVRVTGSNPTPHLLAGEIYIFSERPYYIPVQPLLTLQPRNTNIYFHPIPPPNALPGPGRLPTGPVSHQLPESPPRPRPQATDWQKSHQLSGLLTTPKSTSHQLSIGSGPIRASGGPVVPLVPSPRGRHPHPWLGLERRCSKALSATRTHTDPLCGRAPGSPPPLAAAPRK